MYAASSASAYSFLKGCLITMQRRQVNVLRKYCVMNHRHEQTCTNSDRRNGLISYSARSISAVPAVRFVKSGEVDVRGEEGGVTVVSRGIK